MSVILDITKLPPVCLPSSSDVEESMEEAQETPNASLFRYLLESMQELHDQEIHLTDTECEEFIMLVKQRERDTKK